MALTISEASAVNDLLNYLFVRGHRGPPTSGEARAAAQLLAEHAHKTLMAGIDGFDVQVLWPTLRGGDK